MLAQLRYKYGDRVRNYGIGFLITLFIEGILGLIFPSTNPFDFNSCAVYFIGWLPISYLTIKIIKGLNEGWLTIHHFNPLFWPAKALLKRMEKQNRIKIMQEMVKSEMVSDNVKYLIKRRLRDDWGPPIDSYIEAYQRKEPNYAGYYCWILITS